ncbi:MAG: FHA domain-containing protein [Gemmatimonadetes bacterium]|uniref:FHA domain-containing protein n=1 Tax=Candidatus Kutchimonas denitrificans TaxID=3056748 RepID=A0AAE4ZA23_9BACT|nr:FHA domain-containing protein [Gemmatimonadota bacterium]NIR75322.1 FHA domain-containing protein [Candidatus Kutchimonas denitrificans]NIS02148.1 FHA domain-containing protein [Gemmatimonadota bacterium]NIT67973.1 FHA domain-containing protein [Gemmatimonadota bacterium]NIU53967.1 FHA domain-containing protein [Gemmatimonadota bacterium]
MPFIEFKGNLYRLREGDNVLGSGDWANIRLSSLEDDHHLTISVETVGAFAWTPDDSGRVVINGRPLTREPIPLFHGDRLSLNGSTLVYLDDGGEATVKMERRAPAALAAGQVESDGRKAAVDPELMHRATPPEPEVKVVAVLRRLDNNQAYIIDRSGFRIGREKRCDLIIPDPSVSRLHAEITFSRGAYLLRCLGRTSTRVNGRPIDGPYRLRVGDKVGIGDYEFTFARRPLKAEEIVPATEVTPIRSAVPDAPTVPARSTGRSRIVTWLIVLVGAGLAALMLLA